IWVAIVCGIMASAMTYGMLTPPPETPPGPWINRQTYSVQLPEKQWQFEPTRWESDGADLVVEGTFRGGKGMLLMVHVIHPQAQPLTLDALVEQTKQQWSQQMAEFVFLSDEGGPTTAAGEKAVRLVAISQPYPQSRRDHFKGDRRRCEAVVLIHEGLGYRLTAEELDICFDRVQERFKMFVASFRVGTSR